MSSDLPEELKYVSSKNALLANPGTKLNNTYYTSKNCVVDLVEMTFSQSRVTQSLTSTLFGSSSQIVIPIGSFIGETYLHLRLPNLTTNQSLIRGWSVGAIASIQYMWGSSNIPSISYNKQTLLHALLGENVTAEACSEMLRLAGDALYGPVPDGEYVTADLLLPLPWSSANALHGGKLPFDTSLLQSPITLTIQLDNASAIYGGSDSRPTGFLEASISYRTADLANKNLSLSHVLNGNPSLYYGYPFTYLQSYTSQVFVGSTDVVSPVNIQISSFINADLVGMIFSVVKLSDLSPTGNSTPNPFNYDDISNFTINLNGLNIFSVPNKMYKLTNMQSNIGASYFANNYTLAGSTAPFTGQPRNCYPVFVDFARLRAVSYINYFQNSFRIANQTLNVTFNTTSTAQYQLFVTSCYNACCEVRNQQTTIYIN